jgi:hypothetical protein
VDRGLTIVILVAILIVLVAALVWWLSEDAAIAFGVLSVLALFFASIQFRDARHTIRNVKEVGGKLEESTGRVKEVQTGLSASANRLEELRKDLSASTDRLEEQLSTHRIGVFPKFLPQIAELLGSAEESIVIFCDFPAYGELSALDAFADYAEVVERKASMISLLCLDEDTRRRLRWNRWENGQSGGARMRTRFAST